MAPQLKGKIVLFMLIWVFSTAYWIGSSTYINNYVGTQDEKMRLTVHLMTYVCALTGAMSLIGCSCIFCEVHRCPFIIFFVIPTFLVIPGLCIYGVVQLDGLADVSVDHINETVMEYWRQHNRSPPYLTHLQRDKHCCGLTHPTNYRQFIYGSHCMTQVNDVPFSCCNLEFLHDQVESVNDSDVKCEIESLYNNMNTSENHKKPTSSEEWRSWKCQEVTEVTRMVPKFKYYAHTKGCLDLMMGESRNIQDLHYIFYIVFCCVSLVMLSIFVNNWYNIPQVAEVMVEVDPQSSPETTISQDEGFATETRKRHTIKSLS